MNRRLIIYAKRPIPGYTKTRLGNAIGMEASAGVYARLLYSYLLGVIERLDASTQIELSVASPEDLPFFSSAFPELLVSSQRDGDLGERMADSFAQAFEQGCDSVLLTGSDIPGLQEPTIDAAFDALAHSDIVLGPAQDGGYYLIGLKQPCPHLFKGIAWSTDQVLTQTQERIREQRLSAQYLAPHRDTDNLDDWQAWSDLLTEKSLRPKKIAAQQDLPRRWPKLLLLAGVIAVLAASAWAYFAKYDSFSRDNLRDSVAGFGVWAPAVYALVYTIASPVPLLAPIISAAGGLVFGALMGTILNVIVATVSALVPYGLARHLGRDWVQQRLQDKRIERLYRQSDEKGFVFVLVMRLVPILPWEIQNYIAGLSQVHVFDFTAATLVGIIPATFAVTFLGASLGEGSSWKITVALALVAILLVIVPLVGAWLLKRRTPDD